MTNIERLPPTIQNHLRAACRDLSVSMDEIGFWEVSDYGLFVMMSEYFYKDLNYRKADPAEFFDRQRRNELPYTGAYNDSRGYMPVLIDHFRSHSLRPKIVDIGGYIGRFSLETALHLRKHQSDLPPILCFEPGLTRNVIRANLEANDLERWVTVRDEAVSDRNSTAEYKYKPGVLISGRICDFPSATATRTVETIRLDKILTEEGTGDSVIVKIDTEGNEPEVMAGFGSLVESVPFIGIVEFWPATLNSTVNGMTYAEYIEQNFTVLNIRSSLYPKDYTQIRDIREFAAGFNYREGNIDLLFISRLVPDVETLIGSLMLDA